LRSANALAIPSASAHNERQEASTAVPAETEPPIREFTDRGVLWLLESPRNLHDLVALLSHEIAEHLDFDRAERVNRSFIPEDLHKQEADLLYRVPFRKVKGEVWIYVLVENQSKPDRTMGLRILSYMVQLWELQRRGFEDAKLPVSKWKLSPVLPIVFYSGKRRWRSAIRLTELMDLPELLAPFVPQFETLLLPLQELPPQQLTKTALASALRALQAAQ
jgi:predicted transposase YdaD